MMNWIKFFQTPQGLKALAIFFSVLAGLKLIEYLIQHYSGGEGKPRRNILYYGTQIFQYHSWFLFVVVAFYVSSWWVDMSAVVRTNVTKGVVIAIVGYIILTLHRFINFQARKLGIKDKKRRGEVTSVKLMVKFLEVALAAFLILFLLKTVFGYDIGSWITAFGVGGVIIALALRDFFSGTLSSLVIFWDRPFEVGDFIAVQGYNKNHHGRIERIGFRSTYIRTPRGEQFIVPNERLVSEIIYNYSKKKKTRMKIQFGVDYDFEQQQIAELRKIAEQVVDEVELAENPEVYFSRFDSTGIIFDFTYDLHTTVFSRLRELHQELSFKFKQKLAAQDINIFPHSGKATSQSSNQFNEPDTL